MEGYVELGGGEDRKRVRVEPREHHERKDSVTRRAKALRTSGLITAGIVSFCVILSIVVLATDEDEHHEHHWNYLKEGTDWSGTCHTGQRQSPINICLDNVDELYAKGAHKLGVRFNYEPADGLEITHNGHALQVDGDLGYITTGCCGSTKEVVKQFHFHSPSEHTIDGQFSDMEMHIVHQQEGSSGVNDIFVVGVLFNACEDCESNAFLESLDWMKAPQEEGETEHIHGSVDLEVLKDSLYGSAFAYDGSLTTPGCDETVSWRVLNTTQSMTKAQLEVIKKLFPDNLRFANGHGNNRKVLPLNHRMVFTVPPLDTPGV